MLRPYDIARATHIACATQAFMLYYCCLTRPRPLCTNRSRSPMLISAYSGN
jgi:hypothetical protein